MNKFWWTVTGFFIGYGLCFNLCSNDLHYRISFYGYKEENGLAIPVIKLRRTFDESIFTPKDSGYEIDVVTFGLKELGGLKFTDEQIDNMIKKRYCK